MCIRSNDRGGEVEAEGFLKLMDMEFTNKVSSIAHSTLHANRQRKVQTLPLTEDVVKFHLHVKSRIKSLCEELGCADDESYAAVYQSLAKSTASQIITFNKKRSGEVGRMLITDFTERAQVRREGSLDVFNMLSHAEQKLSER